MFHLHYSDKALELKRVIDPMYCPKSLVHGKLSPSSSIPTRDTVGFEPDTPPSETTREERGGAEVDTNSPAFDTPFSASDVPAWVALFADSGTSWTMPRPPEYGARFESIQQNAG